MSIINRFNRTALSGFAGGSCSRSATAVALATAATLCAAPALAQNNDEDNDDNRIIVTAQFRAQDLQQTPIAITAVTGEQLEQRGQTNIVDIAAQAPNVNLQSYASNGPSLQAFIRGVGQSDFNYAFEPGVGLYVDDVYYSTLTGSVLDLLDLDRVEILRGPQGTLAGMNSIGGAIKLYTRRPNADDGGYAEVTVGSFNRVDVRAGANFALTDNLFARFSGVSRNQDGYVTRYDFACTHPTLATTYNIPTQADGGNCKLGTEGGRSYVAARGSLRWMPTDRLEVNLSGDVTRDSSEAQPKTLLYVGGTSTTSPTGYAPGLGTNAPNYPMWRTAATNGLSIYDPATGTSPFVAYSPFGGAGDTFSDSPYINYSNYGNVKPIDGSAPYAYDGISQVNGWGVSGNIEYDLSDNVNITSITAYRSYNSDWIQDIDATQIGNGVVTYHTTNWQFSQELRLAASLFQDTVDLVVGGFYIDRSSTYEGLVDQGSLVFYENDVIPATDWAAFANVSWRLTDKLELNGGIRYSEGEKHFNFGRLGRAGNVQGGPYQPCIRDGVNYGIVHVGFCGLNGAVGDYKGNSVDYRGVIQYTWNDSVMTYASISTGFKGGGVNPRPYFPDQARPFDPESITAYEVGIKTNFLDNRLRANVSLFNNDYTDFIAFVFASTTAAPNPGCFFNTNETRCSFYVNAGSATLRGAELEVFAEPIDDFTIDFSASVLDFKYNKLSGCSPALDATCTAPSGGLGAGIRYGMKLAYAPESMFSIGAQYRIEVDGAGSLTPRLDYSYQASQEANSINNVLAVIPSYGLLNGSLTWRSEDEDWQVSMQVRNITNELYYTGIAQSDSTRFVTGGPGRPREWSLGVKRNF